MPGLEISIITAKFKTKAEEPQISRFFSKLLKPIDGAAYWQSPGFSLSFTGRRGSWKC
jgi:hypothetical protein